MPVHTTEKVKMRIPRIIQAVREHENMDKVASELGVTRRSLNMNMQAPEYRIEFDRILKEDFEKHRKTTEEMIKSGDPEAMIEAYKEEGKMIRAMMPKTVNQHSENVNIDLKWERLEARELLDSLTVEQQDAIIGKWKERQKIRELEEQRTGVEYVQPEEGVDQPTSETQIESESKNEDSEGDPEDPDDSKDS